MELERAVGLIREHATYDPMDTQVYEQLGDVCLKNGERDKALSAYREAVNNARRFGQDEDAKRVSDKTGKLEK